MQDGADLDVLKVAGGEGSAELLLVHVVGVVGAPEVEELRPGEVRGGGEIVDDEEVALADAVELVDQVAADKSDSSGDDDQRVIPSGSGISMRFTRLVVEKPSTVGTISTRPPPARTSWWPTTVSTR